MPTFKILSKINRIMLKKKSAFKRNNGCRDGVVFL